MTRTKEYSRKQGGISILKQYWDNGVLGTALIQCLLLGKNKTALEILQLSVDLKKKKRFVKRYRQVLMDFDQHWVDNYIHHKRKTVWMFWWQGEDVMPELVKRCYTSVKENMSDWEIVLLTKQNYKEYASFPDYIMEKLKSGIITLTHFSDLLRLELLIKHGGLWLDATVLCTSGVVPNSILKSDLFLYRPQKPGSDGKAKTLSSWLIWAKSNNKILKATQTLLYKYWQDKNFLEDDYLLHQFMSIVMDFYLKESNKIPPFCNSIPHILLLHLFDPYNEQYWNDLKQMACFHKLSYKLNKEDLGKKNTYYDIIIAQEI